MLLNIKVNLKLILISGCDMSIVVATMVISMTNLVAIIVQFNVYYCLANNECMPHKRINRINKSDYTGL